MSLVSDSVPVAAMLLVAPGCPHCPQMKQTLHQLYDEGYLASLDIVDISIELEKAEKLSVRSVPWLALNTLELQGAHSESEIKYWLEQAMRQDGRQQLFDSLLEVGQIAQVEAMIRKKPDALSDLLVLFADPERQINVRIGASAVLESLQDSGILEKAVDEILVYCQSPEVSTRIDVCHVLSFVKHSAAVEALQLALNDSDPEVREVAEESLVEQAESGFV